MSGKANDKCYIYIFQHLDICRCGCSKTSLCATFRSILLKGSCSTGLEVVWAEGSGLGSRGGRGREGARKDRGQRENPT
jgi:hypothetical protein